MAAKQPDVGREELEHFGSPRAVKWLLRLMPEPSSRCIPAARPFAASISLVAAEGRGRRALAGGAVP